MTYDTDRKAFIIPVADMERASHQLLWAMSHVRRTAMMPLDGYKADGPMRSADFAQSGIFDAMQTLGMDTGAKRYNEVDLRSHT
jgi:hypothetical protein